VREIREEQGLEGGRPMPFDEETLRARLHGIYTGELQAMEAAGRTLFDFPDAPWEFQLDMARQVWDEARHSEIFQRLVEYMGGHPGDYVLAYAMTHVRMGSQCIPKQCAVASERLAKAQAFQDMVDEVFN